MELIFAVLWAGASIEGFQYEHVTIHTLGRAHMSFWFAGPRPSHAADPKVKENTKKENAKKENALSFSGREGAEGPGSGREEGSGITWRKGALALQGITPVWGGCRSGMYQNLSECYATVYVL